MFGILRYYRKKIKHHHYNYQKSNIHKLSPLCTTVTCGTLQFLEVTANKCVSSQVLARRWATKPVHLRQSVWHWYYLLDLIQKIHCTMRYTIQWVGRMDVLLYFFSPNRCSQTSKSSSNGWGLLVFKIRISLINSCRSRWGEMGKLR